MMRTLYRHPAAAILAVGLIGCGSSAPTDGPTSTVVAPAAKEDVAALLKKLRTLNPVTQRDAAEGLAKLAFSDPRAITGMVEALKDPANRGEGRVLPSEPGSVREAAVMGLLAAGTSGRQALAENGIPILAGGLTDSNAAVREHTVAALGRAGALARREVKKLWPLIEDPSPHVRAAAYDALREIGTPSADPAAKQLTNTDPAIRQQAAESLRLLGPVTVAVVPTLITALDDPDLSVRGAAADALASLGPSGDPAVPKLLEHVAKTTEEDLRRPDILDLPHIRALIGIGSPAVAPVSKALADTNPIVRFQAAFILGEVGPPARSAERELEKLLNDPVGAVALEVARAIARVGGDPGKVTGLLDRAFTSPEPTDRMAGLRVALRMGPAGQRLTPQVVPMLKDPDAEVRRMAVEFASTLSGVGAKPLVMPLSEVLTQDKEEAVRKRVVEVLDDYGQIAVSASAALGKAAAEDESPEVRKRAVAALGELGPAGKEGFPGLKTLVSDPMVSAELRGLGLAAAVKVGGADAAEPILKALADRSADVRAAAAVNAGAGPAVGPAVAKPLAELAKNDPNPAVKLAALRGLAELGPAADTARVALDALAKAGGPDGGVWAKVALARIDGRPGDGLRVVRDGMISRNVNERMAAVQALPLVRPGTEDMVKLAGVLKDRQRDFRRAAVEAAGRSGRVAAPLAPRVAELLRDPDSDVRQAAAAALGPIGDGAPEVIAGLRAAVRSDPLISRSARLSLKRMGFSEGR